jgi:predicted acyl esterase
VAQLVEAVSQAIVGTTKTGKPRQRVQWSEKFDDDDDDDYNNNNNNKGSRGIEEVAFFMELTQHWSSPTRVCNSAT